MAIDKVFTHSCNKYESELLTLLQLIRQLSELLKKHTFSPCSDIVNKVILGNLVLEEGREKHSCYDTKQALVKGISLLVYVVRTFSSLEKNQLTHAVV